MDGGKEVQPQLTKKKTVHIAQPSVIFRFPLSAGQIIEIYLYQMTFYVSSDSLFFFINIH